MGAQLGATLDAARAAAAVYVVLHHLASAHRLTDGPWLLLRFGQEAVVAFFLISGFVIFANERERAAASWGYLARRFRRIYPPLLVSMLVATIIAWADGTLAARFDTRQLIATIGSLQDISWLKPGVIADPYMGNDPLWSLSYEVFFYAVFPCVLRFWRRNPERADHVIGVSCCTAYGVYVCAPNHFTLVAAYFLVWWSGAMAAHAYLGGARDIRGLLRPYSWLLLLCAISAMAVPIIGFDGVGTYPFLPLRHFAAAALFLALFAGPLGRHLSARIAPAARVTTWVASISFGLYVLHFPILVQWQLARTFPGFCIALVVLVCTSHLVDRTLPRYLPKAPRT